MSDASAVHTDAHDTIRPPALLKGETEKWVDGLRAERRDRASRTRPKTFPVTVRCETEEQRAMLVDWLAEAGFEVEAVAP